MRTIGDIEAAIDIALDAPPGVEATRLLALGEEILELWLTGYDEAPTRETSEGFRLLALHRQGARGDPSFNACRESCRELVYHYNLVQGRTDSPATARQIGAMRALARHLVYFIGGKLENAKLGEFCCSSRPLRVVSADP